MNNQSLSSRKNICIAFFLPHLMGGGAEKVMALLANGLAERGFQVDFLLLEARGVHLSTLSGKVNVIDFHSANAYVGLPVLIRYLRKQQPAVLISSLNLTNLVALLAIQFAGRNTRSIIRIANTLSSQKRVGWKKSLEKILVRWMYPWADAIIAVSQSIARDLTEYAGIPPSKIHVIYNPFISTGSTVKSDKSNTHPWLQNTDIPVVLGVGRLTEQKDFKTLMEAFAMLRKQINARLIILGEGELRQDLETLADNRGVRQDVDLPGYVEDSTFYMRHANVFVLSSAWEGLPNVLIEALSCGCPVVSTDCPGGVREILGDGDYGELVPVGNPHRMAEAILRALSRQNKVVNAQWLNNFSFDRIMDQVTSLILQQVNKSH